MSTPKFGSAEEATLDGLKATLDYYVDIKMMFPREKISYFTKINLYCGLLASSRLTINRSGVIQFLDTKIGELNQLLEKKGHPSEEEIMKLRDILRKTYDTVVENHKGC